MARDERFDTAEDEAAARKSAADYVAKYPLVHQDVTVTLTPHGWVTFDWATHTRIYPPRLYDWEKALTREEGRAL